MLAYSSPIVFLGLSITLSIACDSVPVREQEKSPDASAPLAGAPSPPAAPAQRVEDFPGTYEGAERLTRALLKPGGDLALTKALQPRPEDYAAVFEPAAEDAMRTGAEAFWANPEVIGAMDGQTELRLIAATSDELRKGTEVFPDYGPILQFLRPGFTWYRFKYARPGESAGKQYDGLVHVKDHWAWFPEPWHHVPVSTRPSESDCKKFADHFSTLMTQGQEGPAAEITRQVAEGMKGDLIKECVEKGTQREVTCALAAPTMDVLEKCGDKSPS